MIDAASAAATVVAALAVGAGATAQWLTGIGYSLVSAPFLVLAYGQAEGVRLSCLLSIGVNAVLLAERRRDARFRDAALLLVPGACATPLVRAALGDVDTRTLAAVAGALTIASAWALGAGRRLPSLRGPVGAVAAAITSAAMNVIAGIGGPAVALFSVNAGWPPAAARSTLQAYFLGLNAVALAVLGLPTFRWHLVAGTAVGAVVGRRLVGRVSADRARAATLGLAAAGGAVAVARAVGTILPL